MQKVYRIQLKQNHTMAVKTVFSHLVASESAAHDGFTQQQVTLFETACQDIRTAIGLFIQSNILPIPPLFFADPNTSLTMVRLGIGLYGVDSADGHGLNLQTVTTLKSTIAQIRKIKSWRYGWVWPKRDK